MDCEQKESDTQTRQQNSNPLPLLYFAVYAGVGAAIYR